jgi:UDP-glucose 4-epimerase
VAKILVTGGAGYVGSVCCAELLKVGHSVVVIDDLSTGFREAVPPGAAFYNLDIGDRTGLANLLDRMKIDVVFHFAAKALIHESVRNPGWFFDCNVGSGIAMLEVLRAARIRRFVFSSSAAVYGDCNNVPIVEDHPTRPVNSYGETKLMFEQILRWYSQAYGWGVATFRYFNASGAAGEFGERHAPETHIIPLLLRMASGGGESFTVYGDDYPTPDGTCIRDYVHVSDIAGAHIRALEKTTTGCFEAYNIGSGKGFSVSEVVGAAERVTGCGLPVKIGPRRAGDPAVLVASCDKIRKDLGWKVQIRSLDDIVRSAWVWMSGYQHALHRSDHVRTATTG